MHIFKHLASIHRSTVDATPEVKSTVALSHDIIWYDVAELPWYIAHIIENWVASLKTKEHNVVIYIEREIYTYRKFFRLIFNRKMLSSTGQNIAYINFQHNTI